MRGIDSVLREMRNTSRKGRGWKKGVSRRGLSQRGPRHLISAIVFKDKSAVKGINE